MLHGEEELTGLVQHMLHQVVWEHRAAEVGTSDAILYQSAD